ncbi:uncharacterized protein DFL_006521 [Arthrobotrys flagrans]|uniref:DUF7514 domain-containing protein n=1 Tax=Arthrobotrys flagrans TaxID=97331 RepID=A0A437A0S1_ARTFL|nr:hypothetical protein DFL_006521 [Arthrobotrys flagrans]
MSLRHTIKSLLSGPQTQAPPPGGFGYNQAPNPSPQQQYGGLAPYGYHQAAPAVYGGPHEPYTTPQGQPIMPPNPQTYRYAHPPSQIPQMYAPPPQQQPQYHCPQPPLSSAPTGPVYHQNNNTFSPQNGLSYAPPSVPPPQQPLQQPNPHAQQYSPTPPATATFKPQPHTQAQGQYLPPTQYGVPPPVPSTTHPTYQQPTANPLQQQQQQSQQPTGNSVLQYAQAPPRQDQQQPPRTPLSPPPPYMQFEQPSLSQAVAQPSQSPSAPPPRPVLNFAPPLPPNNSQPSPAGHVQQQQQQQQQQHQQQHQHQHQQLPVSAYGAVAPKLTTSASKADIRDIFGPTPQQTQLTQLTPTQSEPLNAPQRPASTKPQSGTVASEGAPPELTTPSGIIHPSMLAQWSAATSITSGPIPNLPSAHPQSPPKSTSPKPQPVAANTSPAPPQLTYPGVKGHKPTQSVNRSFTFSKKNADGSPNWNGTLLTIDGMSSETFTRFVNGLYNFAGQDEDPLGLTPDQMRVLLERLDMPDERNYPKRYFLAAPKANAADPASFIHTSLIQYYSIFDVTYITESNLMPIVTRDGFQQYMTTEVLIDPSAMHSRFLQLLSNFGHQIIDPFTKAPFGKVQFKRECLPPVPNDQYVARDKKQQEALQARDAHDSQQYYSSDQQISGYHQSSSWGI